MGATQIPQHVAIIMDGNGRWAKQRELERFAGHTAGVNAVHEVVQAAIEQGVKVVSLFAFSSENWSRPPKEVAHLMQLFIESLQQQVASLHDNKVKLRFVGDRSRFPLTLQQCINNAERLTADNAGLFLVIAANYGGRWDIIQAAKRLASHVAKGVLDAADIDEALFGKMLSISDLPAPDLLIRTSGEQRLSNFFLWQMAYTEFVFVNEHWPDFTKKQFKAALDEYAMRQRRYGNTVELNEAEHA